MNNEFYEDEVIEGFYVPAMLKMAWGAQMDVMNETDRICRRHDIPYFADWGSLLATIRHNGYIPWDDDLDICMRRRDYERFLRYAKDELPEGFKVMHFKNHPGHHFFVARIVGKPRICFEEEHLKRFHGFPYIVGVDLFVLDNVCADRKKEKSKAKRAEYVVTVADNIADGKTKGHEAEEQLRQCEAFTGKRIDRRLKGEQLRVRMYELVEELFASIPDDESDALVQMMPYGMYDYELYIPKEYYRKTVRLPYMDTTMSVPLCYDAVMRRKFGNYMEIHKTWDGHDYPFFYGQHKQLLETLDFEYPAYRAAAEDILNEPVRTSGIGNRSPEYLDMIKQHAAGLAEGNSGDAALLQQTAIEFGTAIESAYGEGYGPVRILEELCELAYQASEGHAGTDGICGCVDSLFESVREKIINRKDVIFLPFAPKYWKYMERLYRYYSSDPQYTVSVIPIPYYYKAWDGMLSEEIFDTEGYPSDVEIKDYRNIDLELLHPAKIVIQNPFDEWNPVMSVSREMYSKELRRFTDELVYLPFFVTDDFTKENGPEYVNMDHYVCMPGVINADTILLPTDVLKTVYTDKIMEFTGTDDRKIRSIFEDRIKVSPQYIYDKKEDSCVPDDTKHDGKIIIYFTTLSFLAEHGQKGIEKINACLDIFEQNREKISVKWISQCIKGNEDLIDKNVADGFYEAVDRFMEGGFGEYIADLPKSEHHRLSKICDAYYGDPSAMALSMFYEHKPVMITDPNL